MNWNISINKLLPKRNAVKSIRLNSQSKSTAEYCLESVKQNDYENFMCTLLLKDTSRSSAFAIRGFNVEVARIAEQVTQKQIGLMRLKFWEDTLEKCFSGKVKDVPQHPVAQELYKALHNGKLTKRHFQSLISSRKEHFDINSFGQLEDLEKYSEKSVSTVYYLILEGSAVRDLNADHAASHLGKAQGITQLIRSIPHARRLNMIGLPQDLLAKNKVSQEDILRGKASKQLDDCVYEVASRAHQHLMKCRSILDKVPSNGRTALLPTVAVHSYLERLQKVDYNVFHPSLLRPGWSWLVQLYFKHYSNKY